MKVQNMSESLEVEFYLVDGGLFVETVTRGFLTDLIKQMMSGQVSGVVGLSSVPRPWCIQTKDIVAIRTPAFQEDKE